MQGVCDTAVSNAEGLVLQYSRLPSEAVDNGIEENLLSAQMETNLTARPTPASRALRGSTISFASHEPTIERDDVSIKVHCAGDVDTDVSRLRRSAYRCF